MQLRVRLERPVRPAAGVRPRRRARRLRLPAGSAQRPRQPTPRGWQRRTSSTRTCGGPACTERNPRGGARNCPALERSGGSRPWLSCSAHGSARQNLKRSDWNFAHRDGQSGSHGCGLTLELSGTQLQGAAWPTIIDGPRGALQLCVRLERPVRPAASVRPRRSAHRVRLPAAPTQRAWQPTPRVWRRRTCST
jgi:hypothetical protein